MHPKWIHRYELKPGRWVFHPSPEAKEIGTKIKTQVEAVWTVPDYFFHLRAGGHLRALQVHMGQTSFIHLDIQDFFGCVNRSRVTRCLTPHFGYTNARLMANNSTVRHPADLGKFMLPYGFVQSPLLASLAFAQSKLGSCLSMLRGEGYCVSVYVDDIIISAGSDGALHACWPEIQSAAESAKFVLNPKKQQGPGPMVTAFNIELSHGSLRLHSGRFNEFKSAYQAASNPYERDGIFGYVQSVNPYQSTRL
jgi:hypothetical protein